MTNIHGRGRPSVYWPTLRGIQHTNDSQWHPVREGHKNRTAPSALRKRYEGFDFRMVPDGHGTFTVEARYIGGE